MKNRYEIQDDTVIIYMSRRDGSTVETYIDVADLPRMDEFLGTWFVGLVAMIKVSCMLKALCTTVRVSKLRYRCTDSLQMPLKAL